MKHYLNVCDVNGAKAEPVDVICFGSPCQDLSVAGKRAGLKHESNGDEETTRSGLFMEAVRIIKEMRKADESRQTDGGADRVIRPRFAVWENVPGAFSSNGGEDFRTVLEELARVKDTKISIPMPESGGGKWKPAGEIVGDGWSIAWRTLDAQYHGVPQRRRRIFLVADFADECAGEILFECEGLSGYPSESREEGQEVAGYIENSAGNASERKCFDIRISSDGTKNWRAHCYETTTSRCLDTAEQNPDSNHGGVCVLEPIGFDGYNQCLTGNVSKSITSAATDTDHIPCALQPYDTTHYGTPTVCIQGSMIGRKDENGPQGDGVNIDTAFTLNTVDRHAVAYGISSYDSNAMKSLNPNSGIYEADTARTLDLNGGNPACNQGGICICQPISVENHPNDSRVQVREDGTVQALTGRMGTCGGNVPLVGVPCTYAIKDEGFMDYSEELAATLKARDFKMPQAVCYSLDRASFNQGENAQYDFQINENGKAQTLVAKGPGAVCYKDIRYIVRRLTPTECARLQGMPDMWCRLSHIEDMTDEDFEFWTNAHKCYAEVNGKTYKPKTKEQMIAWYNKLQADSAEYKAYGNGMALPCVRVPIHGIAKHGAYTMASLFDGIGGFPLAGLIDGIETLWTSEIELFPIAVTVERFREYEKYGCFTFGCESR